MSFTNCTRGNSHFFGGRYLVMEPNRRLVYTDSFADPKLPGEVTISVTLTPVSVGTDVTIAQEDISDVIPLEACHIGWQESLRHLARLVEPDTRDG